MNGFHDDSIADENIFLFTSESVGEGHPGEFVSVILYFWVLTELISLVAFASDVVYRVLAGVFL